MSNTNDGGPAFPGTAPMDTEKLIEELPWLLGKYTNGSYWMRDAECDSIRNTILSALRRLAAAEKVVEAVRGLSFGEDWNNGTHAKIYRPQIRPALSAYDAAKEPPCPSN